MKAPNPDVGGVFGDSRNEQVLDFLRDASAHSDVAGVLAEVVRPLGDVQVFSPDLARYRYVAVATLSLIFAFAMGMDTVAFRLDRELMEQALKKGGRDIPAAGQGWVSFHIFRDDRPETDLMYWAREAYRIAREDKP